MLSRTFIGHVQRFSVFLSCVVFCIYKIFKNTTRVCVNDGKFFGKTLDQETNRMECFLSTCCGKFINIRNNDFIIMTL